MLAERQGGEGDGDGFSGKGAGEGVGLAEAAGKTVGSALTACPSPDGSCSTQPFSKTTATSKIPPST
ncbi:MAG: hypothetical protein V1493_03850 [Candidatus Diapherotrites archaeon]